MYRDVRAPRSACDVGRLLDPVVCFDLLLLLLDVVLRLSLSFVRRVRTGSFELSKGNGMMELCAKIGKFQFGLMVILFANMV